MVNLSKMLVTINGKFIKDVGHSIVVHREAIMVKICVYHGISWGKPIFAEFRITSIESILGFPS